MKIDRIVLENFGIYTRKTFEFAAAPLVLIYGPNESGKTTALNGIRQALCGFRMRTPYLHAGRTMSAELAARLSDGRRLEFTRRKGRTDEVSGALDAKRLPPEELLKVFEDLDLETYEQLFGFSLEELRRGEAALKNSRLSDALAGGGLGGMTALQQLRIQLDESLATLYKSRGSTSLINVKLAEIEASHTALRQTQVLPSAIEDLRNQLREVTDRSEQLRKNYAQEFPRRAQIVRLLEALPKYREYQRVKRQLAAIEIPDGIDLAFVSQWTENASLRKTIDAKIRELNENLQREQQQLAQLGSGGQLLDAEREIEMLGHQAARISTSRSRLRELEEQLLDSSSVCRRLLETIDLPEISDRLRDFKLSASLRRELESLSTKFVTVESEILATRAKLEAATESMRAFELSVESDDIPDNLASLVNAVARLQDTERELASKVAVHRELLEDADTLVLGDKLCRVDPNLSQPDSNWRVPEPATVADYHQKTEDGERAEAKLKDRLSEIENRHAAEECELQSLQADSFALTRLEQLNSTLAQRDELLGSWIDELAEPLIAASLTPERQLARLQLLQVLHSQADHLQAEILSNADVLAAAHHKQELLAELSSQMDAARQQLHDQRDTNASLRQSWLELWHACPFNPQTPSIMLQWLGDFQLWCTATRRIEQARREAHILREHLRAQWTQLQDIWPTNLKHESDSPLLQESLRLWQASARDAARDHSRKQAVRATVETLQGHLHKLHSEQQLTVDRFARFLSQSPVDNWPIEQVTSLLDAIEQLRREDAAVRRGQQQASELRTQLAEFTDAVVQLGLTLNCRVDASCAEVEATRWLEQLQSLRDQQKQQIQLSASIKHNSQQVAELTTQLQQLDGKLASLCAATAGSDLLTMSSLMDRVRAADDLKLQVGELTAALDAYRSAESHQDFLAALNAADEMALQLEVQELDRKLLQIDEDRKLSDQTIGAISQRIEQLANNQSAERHLSQLHGLRCELVELADQWVVERLAQELLARSIDRFAADNEPALLQLSRQFLTKLTGGKYTSIDHDNANLGSFLVRNAQDEAFEPARLSTGTREQLYLAIRMAFITHHSERHEALPVIMDDCFVNFDDTRTRLALEAIADWDSSIQTIVLSCHWRVVQILSEVAPHTPVIQLDTDQTTTAGDLAALLAITR